MPSGDKQDGRNRVQDRKAWDECPLWENMKKAKHDVCKQVTDEASEEIQMLDLGKPPEDFHEFAKKVLGVNLRPDQRKLVDKIGCNKSIADLIIEEEDAKYLGDLIKPNEEAKKQMEHYGISVDLGEDEVKQAVADEMEHLSNPLGDKLLTEDGFTHHKKGDDVDMSKML